MTTKGTVPASSVAAKAIRRLAAVLMLAGAMSASGARAADDYFASVAGNWSGNGTYKDHATSKGEAFRCKMQLGWNGPTQTMAISFDCRGIDRAAHITGSLRRASGGVSGSVTANPDNRRFAVTGSQSGNRLALALKESNPKEGRPTPVAMDLSLSGGKTINWNLRSRDPMTGREFTSLSITYKR
ncbi:MAG: hypothetical protein H7A14_09800 [Sinobacteraceae bacterium]|nr:hypothetical protein [Rhodobiaceae bacterium]MCC0041399.1 hypothetical protein [Rhodobiaceae bacterium]MCP5360997.1 hypothetical protein [Nevskiaceae bacterium]